MPFDHSCNAVSKFTRRDIKLLREAGNIGIKVKYGKDGTPVVYLWQTFTTVRIEGLEILSVANELTRAYLKGREKMDNLSSLDAKRPPNRGSKKSLE